MIDRPGREVVDQVTHGGLVTDFIRPEPWLRLQMGSDLSWQRSSRSQGPEGNSTVPGITVKFSFLYVYSLSLWCNTGPEGGEF